MLEAALEYALAGLPVFPMHSAPDGRCSCGKRDCSDPAKHPHTEHGLSDATTDPETIAGWFRQWPDANIGIRTGAVSGLAVLDVDPRHGGQKSLEQLERKHGRLPQGPLVLTGSGGTHRYFADTEGKTRNSTGKLGDGLDVRGEGGYVVAPPSTHANGNPYKWLHELNGSIPAWPLGDVLPAKPTRAERVADAIPQGERNSTLASYAGSMRRRGASEAAILAALRVENVERCKPPLADDEVERIAASVGRYAPAEDPPRSGGVITPPTAGWPTPLRPEAFHGLAGEIVRAIEPHSEADPAALLLQLLAVAGSVIGRGPHFTVEADDHHSNLYVCLVGETSKGRKGSSYGHVERIGKAADASWADRIESGLTSGEGLIWAVRDPVDRADGEDEGVTDKRLLVFEPEFANVLRVFERQGNRLSSIVRDAWDGRTLRTLRRTTSAKASGAHVSIIGHITADELRRYLDRTEVANGFGNRFLWACVRRSKSLPEGGQMHKVDVAPLVNEFREAVRFAGTVDRVGRDDDARELWHEIYDRLSEGTPGLVGALTGRAEAQVMRLAHVYARLDQSATIRRPHLEAALAIWDYTLSSVLYVFSQSVGDPLADTILDDLKRNGSLTRTEIRSSVGGRVGASQIDRALALLSRFSLAHMRREETGGRPSEVWVYGREKSEETEQSQAQTVEETEERPVDEKQRQAFLDSEPEPQELEA